MKRSTLSICLAAAVFAVLFIPTAAQAASTGVLAVSVSGVPKQKRGSDRTVTVRVVSLATGFLVRSTTARKLNQSLKLEPGAYVVAVRTIDVPGIASEGSSGIAIVRAGRKTKRKLRVKRLKGKKKIAKKSVAHTAIASRKKSKKSIWAPESEYAGLRVIGVDPRLTLKGLDEYPGGLEIDSLVTVPLSRGCGDDEPKIRLVEIRRRAEIIEEIERGDDPMFERTVERGHLMRERELVRGSAVISGGKVSVFLRLVDLGTGEVRAAGAATADADDIDKIIDAIEQAGQAMLDQMCGGKVNVTFSGSGAYARDEGTAATDSQDAVRANYDWSVTYRDVNLTGDGTLNFASASSASGSWHTDGRYGVAGPGSYHCEAPIASYSGDFSMLHVKLVGGLTRLTIDPFMSIQGDHASTSCSGLPGPPYASFALVGALPANQASVEFGAADLSASGSLSFNVGPRATLAPDCVDLPQGYESPCSQNSSWSGTVTVTKVQ
ncbi:MAG: hypothetical protein QM648_00100 [Solirubrobacterales bacterium]